MSIDSALVGADSAKTLSTLFTSITPEDRQSLVGLFAFMRVQTVPRGDLLFRPGVSCERFAVVIDGAVRVFLAHGTREKVLYRVEPGQLCVHTLTNLLNDQDYEASAVAETPVRIGWMDAAQFRQVYAESSALQRLVVASLSARCLHFVREIHDLCFRSIASRLAERLLEAAGHEGLVSLSHQELAAQIGSSREVVSRQLQRMATDGLCQLKRGQVQVIDFPALLTIASENVT